jgi:Leucine-rich repeat (LRR) protein
VPDYFCYGCTSLADVTLPSTITSIGMQSFYNCASLREIKLPEGLATIGSSAFAYTALDKVSMPSTVRTIKGNAFANCDNLSTFTVNEGVTAISDYNSIWEGCDNLFVLYLPSTITSLHYNTIGYTNIKEVHLKATVPPTVGSYNVGKSGATLYVPVGTAEAYKAASYWGGWDAIVEEAYTLAGLPEKEWNILKHIPALTGGENWKTKWVLGATPEETEPLEGVTIRNGHIYSIVLGNNNLTGPLPHVVFALDSLNTLYLQNNNLSGNIRMDYEDDTFDYANLSLCCDSLKRLDISGNKLTGDLYDIMAYAPNLKTLKASYNKIRDISNPLPIPSLEFYGQDLRDIYTVNYSDIFNLKGDPKSAVPTVFTYSNKSNSTASANIDTYDNYFYLVISDAWNVNSSGYWYGSMTKRLNNANSSMGYFSYDSWCDGWYTKPLGETLNAGVKTSTNRWNDFHRFNVVMDCRPGDVNFDAQLNITDMQRTLNYALDSTYYYRYTPFNFTAANLIATDRTINVQDVVANINLLLDSGVTPKLAKGNRSKDTAQDEEPEAVLYVKDGKLVLSTTRPVAALDLLFTGENVKWSPAVDAFSKKSKGNRTIVYSLFGDEIMEGETVIAELDGDIDDAMIVDIDGNEIRLNVIKGNYDGTTAIEGAQAADDSNAAVFDLQGRKVAECFDRNTLKPGIYIVNGKKVVIK